MDDLYSSPPSTTVEDLSKQLKWHEERSQERYTWLDDKISQLKGTSMGMDGVSDKVNINLGDGYGRGGGDNTAAIIAAMNSGGGNDALPALIAAQNNRRDDGIGPYLAAMNNNNGMNNLWPLLLLLGLNRRGGFGGGDGDCGPNWGGGGVSPGQAALFQTLTEGQSNLRQEVAESACSVKDSVQALALGTQQGFANTKDAVQASMLANLTATTNGTKDVIAAITALGSKIDNNTILDLQRQLGVAQAATADERHERRSRDVEVNVTQQVNQQQAQAQLQAQIGTLLQTCHGLMIQNSRQAQDIVNLGTMTASGTQAAANTQVR